jgi:hypothetical protein
MTRSEQIGDLMQALAKAQAEFKPITKDTENTYYGSKYAQLDSVYAGIRPALSKHGIALYHSPGCDLERRVASMATYLQLGEQWIRVHAEVPAVSYSKDGKEKFDAQTISIGWTYLKRTQTLAITGVAAEDDDDGNALVGNHNSIPAKQSYQKPDPKPTETKQSYHKPAPPKPAKQDAAFRITPVSTDNGEIRAGYVEGKLIRVTEGTSAKGSPILILGLNGDLPLNEEEVTHKGFCYDQGLFEALRRALDMPVKLHYEVKLGANPYIRFSDVLSVDGVPYENGKPAGMWQELFNECGSLEEFNAQVHPLILERGGEFRDAALRFAGLRNWTYTSEGFAEVKK